MRWSTLCELAEPLGLEVPKNPALRQAAFLVTEPMLDLRSVLQKFSAVQTMLASEAILSRLAYEACEDAYNDGVLILELRYAPTFITEAHPDLSFDMIHRAIVQGVERAKKTLPMAIGLICIIQRNKNFQAATEVMDFAINHRDTFIGVDLADNEDNFDPQPLAPLFLKARKAGLRVTIHAGEIPDQKSPERVQESIEILGAERIGHGVQVIHNLSVLDFLRTQKVVLEVCPWSNYLTQAFPRLEDHPLRKLWNSGTLITLNSDDPGVFHSQLSDDYQLAQDFHGFTMAEFQRSNDIAAAASFIPYSAKEKVWPRSIAGS